MLEERTRERDFGIQSLTSPKRRKRGGEVVNKNPKKRTHSMNIRGFMEYRDSNLQPVGEKATPIQTSGEKGTLAKIRL